MKEQGVSDQTIASALYFQDSVMERRYKQVLRLVTNLRVENSGRLMLDRKCDECDEKDIVLFDIILPPLIKDRTPYCRNCINIILDRELNSSKQKELDKK
jgi:hypothetical protein